MQPDEGTSMEDPDHVILEITTTTQMEHFKMCQCIARLRLETGPAQVRFRQSTLAAVQSYYGIRARSKVKALKELEDLYEKRYGRRYGEHG